MSSVAKHSSHRVGIESRVGPKGEKHRAVVRERSTRKLVRGAWRDSLAEARSDRLQLLRKVEQAIPISSVGPTIREAWDAWFEDAWEGRAWTRSGGEYAPSTLRGYGQVAGDHFLPEFGDVSIFDLRRSRVQLLIDRVAAEHSGQTARNMVTPLCALYRFLLGRHDGLADPTHGLQLPSGSKPRQRVATPAEMELLLDALAPADRTPLALAGLAGLRRGEIRALAVGRVDLGVDLLTVDTIWDDVEGELDRAKSAAGERQVPIFPALRPYLEAQLATLGPEPDLLIPGKGRWGDRIGAGQPFNDSAWRTRVKQAWKDADLTPLGLHEARHSFASWLVLAGYDVASVSEWVGHAHVSTTLDRYVKPMRRLGVTPKDVNDYLGELP